MTPTDDEIAAAKRWIEGFSSAFFSTLKTRQTIIHALEELKRNQCQPPEEGENDD